MRVVVVGASGNVGSALLRRLAADETVTGVVAVARHVPDRASWPAGVEWVSADVSSRWSESRLVEAARGADRLVSLSWGIQPAHDEAALWRTNVDGTLRVLRAARTAGVAHAVYVSSIGAYAPRPPGDPVAGAVGEDHPVTGVGTSQYSRQKAWVEQFLPAVRDLPLAVLRPGLVFQSSAGHEVVRYFLGNLVPRVVLRRRAVPVLPLPGDLVVQAVHADDLAEAIRLALHARAEGAFNVAAEPVLGPAQFAEVLDARHVPVPAKALRTLASVTFHAHLQPSEPGWMDLALLSPVMRTDRIRAELGWEPTCTSTEALAELLDGVRRGAPDRPPL
ncbi:nucleoside-diphosphate-sugar epimerase [Kineococcus xinjiangensis]|uniref:Nucleoside-diphosphate-sugar epimerase n=1 Tax=Kineococcus xinjiangensis TaxID=512762 RepID=A0A2S6ITE8_9ACTN|nr:NAD-dependent epimerase/dehydratase family protein [Kineococcus xinjiangensis]PPK97441.1 nucleoside-diphosphate-sugar epimerase [Kineococcus xinjiangensis]